jgi:hypothetical protein
MPQIPGGSNAEAIRYAGQDLKALGLYAEINEGIASAPPVRGSNLLIPYQHGQRWILKYYDERVVVLAGEMFSTISRTDFYAKLDTLKSLFAIGAGEQKLEVQRQDGSFRYINAEVRNTLGLQHTVWPPKSSKFSIELIASDPLWYGSVLEAATPRQAWTLDSGILLDDGAHWFDQTSQAFARTLTNDTLVEATNSGDAANRKLVFTFNVRARLAVGIGMTNLRNNLSWTINRVINGGEQLIVDCGTQQALLNGAPFPISSVVLGNSQTDWMRLEPGENTLRIALGGAPTIVDYSAQYAPTWL